MGVWSAARQVMKDALSWPTVPTVTVIERPLQFAYQPVIDAMSVSGFNMTGRVSRDQALEVAAVQRARNQICSLATLPLRLFRGLDAVTDNTPGAALFRQFDPNIPNVVHLAATLEDLLFEGIAWWLVTARDFDGYPFAVQHLPISAVQLLPPPGAFPAPLPSGVDPGRPAGPFVYVDGRQTLGRDVIRFDSPNPGLLHANRRAISRALLLDRLARVYAENWRPLDWFTDSTDPNTQPPDDDELENLLNQWASQRRARATAKVPTGLVYNAGVPVSAADLQLVELQRQVTLEIANGAGVDPEDLGLSTTSRTYFNAQDRRISKVNETFSPFMSAITDRLAMGDVTRRGYAPRWDLTDFLKADTLSQSQVATALTTGGIASVDEVRPWFGLSGPAPSAPADGAAPDGAGGSAHEGRVEASASPAEPQDLPSAPSSSTAPTGSLAVTFSASSNFTSVSHAGFSVDVESRTIRGLAAPYGVPGTKYGTKYVFEGPGSLVQPESGRVKHFQDHAVPVGVVTEWNADGPEGLRVAMSVMPGDVGDRLLAAAAAGVYDGLSVGLDFDRSDPQISRDGRTIRFTAAHPAVVREITTTATPVFDSARVTSVAASHTQGASMDCPLCGQPITAGIAHVCAAPATAPATAAVPPPAGTLPADFAAALMAWAGSQPAQAAIPPALVDPTGRPLPAAAVISEPQPYVFSHRARNGDLQFASSQPHQFSQDLLDMSRASDVYGHNTDAGRRVMALLQATFADIASDDINELNPTIQRPDLYTDVPDYKRPIWDLIGRGAPPNGIQPFAFPLFSSSSGLVAAHTEETEPSSGTLVTTSQTIVPTGLSGKANITREVWDMGGNPAVSGVIYNKMVQGYWEAIETAAATFLNTLTAATDLALTAGNVDTDLTNELEALLTGLQFVRGYNFDSEVSEAVLYKALAAAVDQAGRKIYPMLGPTNANGTAQERYQSLDVMAYRFLPSPALASTPGSSNNSWLFDKSTVYGWATPPQRLEFPGADSSGAYAPVAFMGLGIWGYKAFANTDIGGVRQLTYDSTL